MAMGGYGREELSPFSDVDLLLLHLPGKGKDLAEWVQALLHPLWDWGLTVGYTVQTPKDTLRAAAKDLDLFLSFLDARWVAGDKGLFLRWQEEFSRGIKSGKEKEVILQVQQRALARHKKLGDSVFVLEPEVKEGKGGLRDYHSAFWAAKIKYHIRSAGEITEKGLSERKRMGKLLPGFGVSLAGAQPATLFSTGGERTGFPSRTKKRWPRSSVTRGRIPLRPRSHF